MIQNTPTQFLLYTTQKVKIEVLIENETVWLTQKQMSELFDKSRSTINEHIKNIYKENELQEENSINKFGNSEFAKKPTNFYNLDVIISVGYRTNSKEASRFRIWSLGRLQDFILNELALNSEKHMIISEKNSSVEERLLSRIYGRGKGYAFSPNDFIDEFLSNSIDKALSTLTKKLKIRRVARGVYDYPKYSNFLEKELSPDIEQVAQVYARKFNWKIEVSGDTALNILGLSTQVPGKYIYLSNGPNKHYKLKNGTTIEFKKASLKNIGFKYKESSLIVQALKMLGKDRVDDEVIKKIRKKIDSSKYSKILNDTKSSTVWIYETIKKICKVDDCE